MSQDLCKSGFKCLNDEKFWKIILILFLCGSKMLNKSCCCLNVNINSRDQPRVLKNLSIARLMQDHNLTFGTGLMKHG